LSVGEAKRCHSFPDVMTFQGDYSEQWARIGNSVPPLFMRAIARHIRATILQSTASQSG
jgi:DNA (cytosine-5)-methyltransferase 1